jgi:hypothetical protein
MNPNKHGQMKDKPYASTLPSNQKKRLVERRAKKKFLQHESFSTGM